MSQNLESRSGTGKEPVPVWLILSNLWENFIISSSFVTGPFMRQLRVSTRVDCAHCQ